MSNGNVMNDWSSSSKAIENANYIEVPEETHVFSWSPAGDRALLKRLASVTT